MLEKFINPLIGQVEEVKRHQNGFVKYKIAYSYNDRVYHRWSSWIKYDGYEVGDSISLKMLHFPSKQAIIRLPIDVNNNPQQYPIATGILIGTACAATGIVGLVIGRALSSKKQ